MQSQPSSSSSPSENQSIDPSSTPTNSNQASSDLNPLLPSITTSTPNKKTFSILSSNNAPSTLPVNKNPKRSLSSHQALLRSGPKVSSASAIGVGAKISSYGVNQKIGLTSPSSEEGSLNLGNDSSGESGSERDNSGATERLEGLQDGGGSVDESKFLSETSSLFSPGINSGELDRRLEMTEEHQRAITASSRPEFDKRNSSSNSSTSASNQSSISPTTLIRPSAPSMLRTNTNGSGSTASLSPMSERSFCLSDGGGSCESAITTPGPSPFRKDFNLENDGGGEIEIEKSMHQRERSYTYSEPSGLFNEKSIQHSGRSSEPNGGYSSSNSSGETTTGSKIRNIKSSNGSSSSIAISRAGSLRSSHSGSGRNSNSSLSSYPRHVRRSTFGRDSTTGKWLYSPTSTPISSRSASANISNVFKQDHPKVEKEIPGVEENETSTQVHHFALPLPERAPLNLEADNKKSKGTWRNSFNWETSGGGGGGDQSWNQDGEISPKKVTFGQREINQPTRNVEKIKAFNGKSLEEWLGNEKEKDGNDASSEASNLRTQSLANPRLEEVGLLHSQPSRASSAPNVSFDLEASRVEDQGAGGQIDSPPPLPPAYLRNSAGATRDSDLLKNSEQEGNQVESTHDSREIQVEVSSSNPLTSSRGRAQSSPNSSQWSNQVKSGKAEESIVPSSPPPLTSRHSIDVAQTSKIEPEVDVYHLPAVAIAARAVATVNVVQSPSIPSLNPSSSTTAFSSTFPFMVALVPSTSTSTSTSDSRPSFAQQQLLRRRSERDVTTSKIKSGSNSSLRPNGTRSAFLASTPQKSTFLENEVITEEPSTLNKAVTPPRARAVSASSTFTGLDHSSPGSSPSFKSVGDVGSRSPIQASPRGKFTSKFKGGNLDLSPRKKPRESQVRAAQSVTKEGSGNIVPKDVEVDTPMESLEDSFSSIKSEGKGDRTNNQKFDLIKPSSEITFSSFQVSADPTPRPSDLGDPFELDNKNNQLSSPTKSAFKPSSSNSSESARHISARALASRLLTGDNIVKNRSNHLLAVSNPRFAKAISASHDTDGEDSDGGYSSETPVPTPNAGTPLPIKDPIETAMSNGCAITPPLESSSASSTPVKSTFSLDVGHSLEETILEAQQRKRGSYPFGLTKPSTASNPPSPLELPDLLFNSIPSSKSDDWSIKSRECLEALEMDSKGAEWGQVKLKALEKGWKRRTVAGILEASSSSPLQTASRIISTPSSILADAAKRQAEKSLLEGAKEARASNRHKTWAPERFGEELGNSARKGVGREFSREEARVAMNVAESLEAVAEDSKEASSSFSTSIASSSRGIQSPIRPPRPPKSALRMITSPKGVEKLLSNVTLDSSSSEAAAASEKKKRRSLPAQTSSSSSPTTILTPIPRSARRPTFIHKESDSFSSTSNVVKRLEEANDEEESDFALGLGLKLDPFENSKSTPKPERKHSRIPSLVEDRESSLGNLKTSLSFSQALASGLINPLHSPLAQAAVSNLNSPTSRSFSQAQLRQSILLASSDVEKEMEKLAPYRVTPRPEGRDGMVGINGEILPR